MSKNLPVPHPPESPSPDQGKEGSRASRWLAGLKRGGQLGPSPYPRQSDVRHEPGVPTGVPASTNPSVLRNLIGESLSSVVFVMDYLQLDFNGTRLSSYVWPKSVIGSTVRSFGEDGYRDQLCAFIDHEVCDTDETVERGLEVRFDLGAIVIDPALEDLTGPEIAVLHVYAPPGEISPWSVWRPGEDIFDRPGW